MLRKVVHTEKFFHKTHFLMLLTVENVSVPVKGERNRGMSENSRKRLVVHALLQSSCGKCMTKM